MDKQNSGIDLKIRIILFCFIIGTALSIFSTPTSASKPAFDKTALRNNIFNLSQTINRDAFVNRKLEDTSNNVAVSPIATPTVNDSSYTEEEIDYFQEIALGSEYGSNNDLIRKWTGEIRVAALGKPTSDDLATLDMLMNDIAELTEQRIQLKKVDVNPNITIRFTKLDDMGKYELNYVADNWGFFWTWWNSNNEIYRANILVSSDKPTQAERNHLIREELTQCLGLMHDSWVYPDSTFYQGWTSTQEYSNIDLKMIQTLYRDDIKCGMTKEQVQEILTSVNSKAD